MAKYSMDQSGSTTLSYKIDSVKTESCMRVGIKDARQVGIKVACRVVIKEACQVGRKDRQLVNEVCC